MSYKDELKKQHAEACKKCDELAKTCSSKDGFTPIIKACQERDKLAEQLKKL
ncbi:MAG: hypothetical protein J6D03_11355 [Clostridia bacterium]|nr:hypothetical protein [Clostridia bacterium]